MAEKEKKFVPFEKTHELKRVKLFIIVINEGQADGVVGRLHDLGCACSIIMNASGTAKKEMYNLIGLDSPKKQLILALVSEQDIDKIKTLLDARFKISNAAKGIAFSLNINSVIGVAIYKFLTNTRDVREAKKHEKTK